MQKRAILNPAVPLFSKVCGGYPKQFEQGITISWSENGCANNSEAALTALPGGNRNNNGTFNNIGNNGYWWSSTAYDATNAWKRNLNYNNSQVNRNNNNKVYGFSVRCVRDLNKNLFNGLGGENHQPFSTTSLHSHPASELCPRHPALSDNNARDKNKPHSQDASESSILVDLFKAYYDARKNKRNTINALKFEKHFEANIFELYNEIIESRYEPKPSICFIVNKPVKREIFAADFRDRVVHHLIFNYISPVYEKAFINDSYSCRKAKGTHYGINRIDKFIRSCSQNYSKECYILKLDIKGYFMSIDKQILFDILKQYLLKQQNNINI